MAAGPLEVGGARWWLAPGSDPDATGALLARALDALARGAAPVRRGRRKALYRLALAGPQPDHLLKVNDYAGAVSLARRLRASKARRELARAEGVARRGVPTPLPRAAGEVRRRGLLERCYLLLPLLDDAEDLLCAWQRGAGTPGTRRAWQRELGLLARAMHDAGIDQADFAPNNFLLRPGDPPALLAIDFERTRLQPQLGVAARRAMLAKLDRHFTGASAAARMRFLLAYAQGQRTEARRWWRAVEAHQPVLARRDLRHLRRTATRAGRRFAPVERGELRGWLRRDGDPERALWAIEAAERGEDAGPHVFVRPLRAASPREAGRTWAQAQLLFQRGAIAPRPLALLRRGDTGWLALERGPTARRADELDDPAVARAALAVLLDRLLRLGARPETLALDAFATTGEPPARAHLLDPTVVDPATPPRADARQAARALAHRLTDC